MPISEVDVAGPRSPDPPVDFLVLGLALGLGAGAGDQIQRSQRIRTPPRSKIAGPWSFSEKGQCDVQSGEATSSMVHEPNGLMS